MPWKPKEPSAAKTAQETIQRGIRRSHEYISHRLRTNKIYRGLRMHDSPESIYVLQKLPPQALSERQTAVHKKLIEPTLGPSSDAQRRVFAEAWDETEQGIISETTCGPRKIAHDVVDRLLKEIQEGALEQEPNTSQLSPSPVLEQNTATSDTTPVSGDQNSAEPLSTSALSTLDQDIIDSNRT